MGCIRYGPVLLEVITSEHFGVENAVDNVSVVFGHFLLGCMGWEIVDSSLLRVGRFVLDEIVWVCYSVGECG